MLGRTLGSCSTLTKDRIIQGHLAPHRCYTGYEALCKMYTASDPMLFIYFMLRSQSDRAQIKSHLSLASQSAFLGLDRILADGVFSLAD